MLQPKTYIRLMAFTITLMIICNIAHAVVAFMNYNNARSSELTLRMQLASCQQAFIYQFEDTLEARKQCQK